MANAGAGQCGGMPAGATAQIGGDSLGPVESGESLDPGGGFGLALGQPFASPVLVDADGGSIGHVPLAL